MITNYGVLCFAHFPSSCHFSFFPNYLFSTLFSKFINVCLSITLTKFQIQRGTDKIITSCSVMLTFVRRQWKTPGLWVDRYHGLSGLLWSQIFARTQSLGTSPNLITSSRLFKKKARTHTCALARGDFTHMPFPRGPENWVNNLSSELIIDHPSRSILALNSEWRYYPGVWTRERGNNTKYVRHNSTITINILAPKGQLHCHGWGVSQKWSKIMCIVIPNLFLEFRRFI